MRALAPLLALAVAAALCGCMTDSSQGQYVGLAPTDIQPAVASGRSVPDPENPQPLSPLTPGQMPEFTEQLGHPDAGKIAAVRGGDIMVMTEADKADRKRHLAELKKMLASGPPGVEGMH